MRDALISVKVVLNTTTPPCRIPSKGFGAEEYRAAGGLSPQRQQHARADHGTTQEVVGPHLFAEESNGQQHAEQRDQIDINGSAVGPD